jgi:hypothetical protein
MMVQRQHADVVMGFSDQRIRYFFAENRGVAVARNQAISDAKVNT